MVKKTGPTTILVLTTILQIYLTKADNDGDTVQKLVSGEKELDFVTVYAAASNDKDGLVSKMSKKFSTPDGDDEDNDRFDRFGHFSPRLNCSQFWNIFPNETWRGCEFWYGPSLSKLVRSQNNNKNETTMPMKATCKLNVSSENFGGFGKFQNQIEFQRIDHTTSLKDGGTFVTATKFLSGLSVTDDQAFVGGFNFNGNCQSELKMWEIVSWLRKEDDCSFWLGPSWLEEKNDDDMMVVDTCQFPESQEQIKFSILKNKMVPDSTRTEGDRGLLPAFVFTSLLFG